MESINYQLGYYLGVTTLFEYPWREVKSNFALNNPAAAEDIRLKLLIYEFYVFLTDIPIILG